MSITDIIREYIDGFRKNKAGHDTVALKYEGAIEAFELLARDPRLIPQLETAGEASDTAPEAPPAE